MANNRPLEEHVEPLSHILRHIKQILRLIYSEEHSATILAKLKNLMDVYRQDRLISAKRRDYEHRDLLSEKDAILMTYADTIYREEEKPLTTLRRFLKDHVREAVMGVHLLPFFPSSSDAGYAVIDYKEVDPELGTWEDVRELAKDYRLMVDLVLNHVSSRSKWFLGFLKGDRRYRDYFIWSDKRQDLLFFDFLASHDGIALLAAKKILSKEAFEGLLKVTKAHGGLISSRSSEGGEEPYELNMSYFDAMNDPRTTDDPLAVKRFMASQAIMLTLKGVPGVYVHSLLGSRNNVEGVKESGINRMINREKLQVERLEASLVDARSLRHQVFVNFLHLLNVRKRIAAFHPAGTRQVLDSDKRLLVVSRSFEGESIHVVINVSKDQLPLDDYKGRRHFNLGRTGKGDFLLLRQRRGRLCGPGRAQAPENVREWVNNAGSQQ
jgi:hypothetical protein